MRPIDAFRRIAESPAELTVLMADASVADFIGRLEKYDIRPDDTFLESYNLYSRDPLVSPSQWMAKEPTGEKDKQISNLMRSEEFAGARAKLLAFVRRKILVEQLRMDPDWMLDLMIRYGPMDWRSVNSHALYWSTLGLHRSENKELSHINALNTGRIYLDSLKSLTYTGQVYYTPNPGNPEEPFLDFEPDLRFVKSTDAEYLAAEKILVRKPSGEDGELDSTENLLRDGHINYLSNSVILMYDGGWEDMAREYYEEIKYTLKAKGDVYELDLLGFVNEKRHQGGVPTLEMTRGLMAVALRSAYLAMTAGNQSEYIRKREAAKRVYRDYTKDVADKQRLTPPPFEEIERNFLMTMLVQPQAIGFEIPLVTKANVYNALSPTMRRQVFPLIADRLRDQCRAEGFDFAKAFPAPPETP